MDNNKGLMGRQMEKQTGPGGGNCLKINQGWSGAGMDKEGERTEGGGVKWGAARGNGVTGILQLE